MASVLSRPQCVNVSKHELLCSLSHALKLVFHFYKILFASSKNFSNSKILWMMQGNVTLKLWQGFHKHQCLYTHARYPFTFHHRAIMVHSVIIVVIFWIHYFSIITWVWTIFIFLGIHVSTWNCIIHKTQWFTHMLTGWYGSCLCCGDISILLYPTSHQLATVKKNNT